MFRLNLFTINQQFRQFMLLIAVKLAVTNEDPETNRFHQFLALQHRLLIRLTVVGFMSRTSLNNMCKYETQQ